MNIWFLKNEIKISLNNDNHIFTSGFISYENLQETNSDRYEYILMRIYVIYFLITPDT